MNIGISTDEATQLQVILTDALARATTMANYPNVNDDMRTRQRAIADVCLSMINKIKHEQLVQSANKAQAVLRERVTGERIGTDR